MIKDLFIIYEELLKFNHKNNKKIQLENEQIKIQCSVLIRMETKK